MGRNQNALSADSPDEGEITDTFTRRFPLLRGYGLRLVIDHKSSGSQAETPFAPAAEAAQILVNEAAWPERIRTDFMPSDETATWSAQAVKAEPTEPMPQ